MSTVAIVCTSSLLTCKCGPSIRLSSLSSFSNFPALFSLPFSYATTDRAWRTLREMNADQNIVITGEAGSGKTEAAKLTLHYLAAVTSHAPECHPIKHQILQSNPVLEGENAH